jgi:hypothetical protein
MPRPDTTEAVVISALRVRLAASEPKALKLIGEESKRNGTDALTARKIDQIIESVRSKKPER